MPSQRQRNRVSMVHPRPGTIPKISNKTNSSHLKHLVGKGVFCLAPDLLAGGSYHTISWRTEDDDQGCGQISLPNPPLRAWPAVNIVNLPPQKFFINLLGPLNCLRTVTRYNSVTRSIFQRKKVKTQNHPRKLQTPPPTKKQLPFANYERVRFTQSVGNGCFGACSTLVYWYGP